MSDDESAPDVQRLEENEDVVGLSALVSETRRPSESPGVVAYHLKSGLERRNLVVPDTHVVGPTMDEHHSRSPSGHFVVNGGAATNIERARLRAKSPAN